MIIQNRGTRTRRGVGFKTDVIALITARVSERRLQKSFASLDCSSNWQHVGDTVKTTLRRLYRFLNLTYFPRSLDDATFIFPLLQDRVQRSTIPGIAQTTSPAHVIHQSIDVFVISSQQSNANTLRTGSIFERCLKFTQIMNFQAGHDLEVMW